MLNMTAIFVAAKNGNIPWMRKILKREPHAVAFRDCDGITPLMHALENSRMPMVEFLINSGARLDDKDLEGDPTLFYALFGGRGLCLEMVDVLIQKGIDIDTVNVSNRTALHVAACSDAVEVASFLIGNGADVNRRDNKGRTPLFYASDEGHRRIVVLLINANTEIDQCDNQGRTALMIACQRNFADIVNCLIEAGADVTKKDRVGKMALDYYYRNRKEVSRIPKLLHQKLSEYVQYRF